MNYDAEYDRWVNSKVNDQEKVLGHCEYCEEEVYPSDVHYRGLHEVIHEDCLVNFAIDVLRLKLIGEYEGDA